MRSPPSNPSRYLGHTPPPATTTNTSVNKNKNEKYKYKQDHFSVIHFLAALANATHHFPQKRYVKRICESILGHIWVALPEEQFAKEANMVISMDVIGREPMNYGGSPHIWVGY